MTGSKDKKTPEYQLKASAKYAAAHTRRINLAFYDTTDLDILAKLSTVGNTQGYIKALIRADLEREKNAKNNI